MIDLPPPYPPPEVCVGADSGEVARVVGKLTLSGEPGQVGAVLDKVREVPRIRVAADAQANGIRFVHLFTPGDLPYRTIGGLIYEAQRRRVIIGFTTSPPICSPDEQP